MTHTQQTHSTSGKHVQNGSSSATQNQMALPAKLHMEDNYQVVRLIALQNFKWHLLSLIFSI
jgi:hypothetical protein